MVLSLAAWELHAATVSARVRIVDSRVSSVRQQRNFAGVVLWLTPLAGGGGPRRSPGRVEMIQKDKKFQPHVLAIPVGTTVDFPNYDPIFHNAFSNFDGQVFDIGLYAPGSSRGVTFRREGIVRVFCNIHPTMSAVIIVLGTPHFGTSNSAGEITLRDVPVGDYRLELFHERATPQTLEKLATRVTVPSEGLALPPIEITESGYLQVPHKNKHGMDYPASSADHVVYPGAKR